jgi:hypothetical protein
MACNSSSYGLIIQSFAVLISALGVVAIIVWNVLVTRRRTTVEMLLAEQTKPELLDLRSKFLAAAKEGKLESLVTLDKIYSPESFCLISTLNRYDLVAIGISEKTIDEKIYKRYWRSSFVQDWIRCKKAVTQWRQTREDPNLFSDVEQLAHKWARPKERPLL